jgi:flagellar basal body-associated protein FliL
MAAAEEKVESAGAPAAARVEGSKLVLILTGVNLLATIGMVAILFISFKKESSNPSVDDIAAHGDDAHGEKAAGGGHGEAKKDEHGNPIPGGGGAAKPSHFGRMVTLEQFTVNLSTPGSVNPKFVRVNISLEVPTEDAEAEVNTKMPQVRNAIIDLFNSKRSTDLATAEGRDYLKEEIRNALNGFLVSGKVKGVYFTNFALSS